MFILQTYLITCWSSIRDEGSDTYLIYYENILKVGFNNPSSVHSTWVPEIEATMLLYRHHQRTGKYGRAAEE